MITHDQALDLAATAIDFELDARERADLEAHLAGCVACAAEAGALANDARRLRRLPPIAPPDWVRHAVGRHRRPIGTLLLAAALAVAGTLGAATVAGELLNLADPMETSVPTLSPTGPEPTVGPTFEATRAAGPQPTSPVRTFGWTAGPDMASPRAFHTATRLEDGRVLIAGGSIGAAFLDSAELFDPERLAFLPAPSMLEPRSNFTATLLQDGRVLVAGGRTDTAELYDPARNAWLVAGSMSESRFMHQAVLLNDGRVLAVGGTVGGSASSTAELYDPATNRWTVTGSMSIGRVEFTATLLLDGRVLVAGGVASPGTAAEASAEIYDPGTGTFSETTPMNQARRGHAAIGLEGDGRVLVSGGTLGGSNALASSELFDFQGPVWMEPREMSEPREAFTLLQLAPDSRALAVGGYSQGSRTTEFFDPGAATWLLNRDTSAVRGYHTATLLLNGQVLIAGGLDETQTVLRSIELGLP